MTLSANLERKPWTLSELLSSPELSPQFVVDDILPPGLLLFVAGPKTGKTRLMLQVAEAVVHGDLALGRFQSQRGSVLYYALEDRRERIKRSATSIGLRASEDLVVFESLPAIDERGRQQILEDLELRDDFRLVVIDVLNRVMPRVDSGKGAYHDEAAALMPLQQLAADKDIAVVLVHHTNKNPDVTNPLFTVNGTQALAGTADNLWFLSRDPKGGKGQLHVMGRDVREQTVPLEFSPETGSWAAPRSHESSLVLPLSTGIGDRVREGLLETVNEQYKHRQEILQTLADSLEGACSPTYLERVMDGCLKDLVASGAFEKKRDGRVSYFKRRQVN